jgi:hypothetical protein
MADPTYEALPGELDLVFIKGDEVGVLLTLENQNLTGFTFDSHVYSLATVGTGSGLGAGVSVAAGQTAVQITVTPVAVTAGRINISMSEIQTNQLQADGQYRWWLKTISPGLVTRTVVAGDVKVRMP